MARLYTQILSEMEFQTPWAVTQALLSILTLSIAQFGLQGGNPCLPLMGASE
jgi:hypothetical protein